MSAYAVPSLFGEVESAALCSRHVDQKNSTPAWL